MSLRQIIILGLALAAAIGALVLVRMSSATQTSAVASEAQLDAQMVLVAARDIPAGVKAQADHLAWVEWPQSSIHPSFLTQAAMTTALEDFTGAVARVDVLAGEPITAQRLVKPGDQGFFAAILTPGYLAIAMPITKETAASGFIMPNDRVDVLLAREIDSDRGGSVYRSDIILRNVRVLAIGETLRSDATEPATIEGSTATLELAPLDAETLAMARKMGDVHLALRSLDGEAFAASSGRGRPPALDQLPALSGVGVRVHAYGAVVEGKE